MEIINLDRFAANTIFNSCLTSHNAAALQAAHKLKNGLTFIKYISLFHKLLNVIHYLTAVFGEHFVVEFPLQIFPGSFKTFAI